MKRFHMISPVLMLILPVISCMQESAKTSDMTDPSIRIIQLNPGHFHAGLVQKTMYGQVDPLVHVYAPEGPEVEDYLARIEGYNNREDNPTTWETILYTEQDYLGRMLGEKPGNVVVTAGNNALKTEYIKKAVEAGMNVFTDKPMVINPGKFPLLEEAFRIAGENGVFLYDIMTERYEITTILQRELSMIPEVFGHLQEGSPEEPAVTIESVHYLYKYVSGKPLRRPGWFFDVAQQGTGISDVGTHLVDLVQWECFPARIIDYNSDITVISAKSWSTVLDTSQFKKVTGIQGFPDYLEPYVNEARLSYPCNGEIIYRIKGIYAKVAVIWNYQAPEGTGDTHYSIMRGTLSDLIIKQGPEEEYKPTLYVEAAGYYPELDERLETVVSGALSDRYPGIKLERLPDRKWKLIIPATYKVGHEAHFAQVFDKYMSFIRDGKMPDWEVPNMIAKYYTTTKAQEMINIQ